MFWLRNKKEKDNYPILSWGMLRINLPNIYLVYCHKNGLQTSVLEAYALI